MKFEFKNIDYFIMTFLIILYASCKSLDTESVYDERIRIFLKEDNNSYSLYTSNNFPSATVIKDTIKNDYSKFSSVISSNYIPIEREILAIEQNVLYKYRSKRKNLYRQYIGFKTQAKDTIIEVAFLKKYGIKNFDRWKSKPFEIIEMHKKRGQLQFLDYLYFKPNGNQINSDSLRKVILENMDNPFKP